MRARISSWARILSRRAFSTLRILPRRGRMAWKRRSRPSLADPPAEGPSTTYSSQREGARSEQSASLPGRAVASGAPLRMTRSRAVGAGVVVGARGQARAEARGVGAAVWGVDAVGEGEGRVSKAVVVLHCHIDA